MARGRVRDIGSAAAALVAAAMLAGCAADRAAQQIERLRSPDPAERALAAMGLGEQGPRAPTAVPALIGLLSDGTLLRWVGDRLEPLDVGHSAWEKRVTSPADEARKALVRIGEPALAALAEALREGGRRTRRQAAWALWEIGGPRVVDPLIGALEDEAGEVRSLAARALGKLGAGRAAEPLMGLVGDPDRQVRAAAAGALGDLGAARAIPVLIAELRDEDPQSVDARSAAICALGAIGDPRAVEPIVAALRDGQAQTRWHAARALGALGDERAVQPLAAALQDPDPTVRWRVAEALGAIGDRRATDALVAAVDDPACGHHAAKALGRIGDRKAVEPLLAALRSERVQLRNDAAEALGALGDVRAARPLIALFGEEYPVGQTSRAAVEQMGDAALAPLIDSLREHDGSPHSKGLLLAKMGDPAAAAVIELLRHQDSRVRRRAAYVLGVMRVPRATEALIDAVRDPEYEVRYTAWTALTRISGKKYRDDHAKWRRWWARHRRPFR